MNTIRQATLPATLAIAALATATLLALPAQAQEATPDHPQAVSSTLDRAAVRAEAAQARAAGLIVDGEATPLFTRAAAAGSALVRAEVRAEAIEARKLGLTVQGEASPLATDAQLAALAKATRDARDRARAIAREAVSVAAVAPALRAGRRCER